MVDLLLKQHFFHIFASFGAKQRPRMDAPPAARPSRAGKTRFPFPARRPAHRTKTRSKCVVRSPSARKHSLSISSPKRRRDQVGGHVVAQGHHQLAQRVQRTSGSSRKNHSAPAGGTRSLPPRLELFRPSALRPAPQGTPPRQTPELDDAGGEKRLVLPHAELLARGKVLIIQSAAPPARGKTR